MSMYDSGDSLGKDEQLLICLLATTAESYDHAAEWCRGPGADSHMYLPLVYIYARHVSRYMSGMGGPVRTSPNWSTHARTRSSVPPIF